LRFFPSLARPKPCLPAGLAGGIKKGNTPLQFYKTLAGKALRPKGMRYPRTRFAWLLFYFLRVWLFSFTKLKL